MIQNASRTTQRGPQNLFTSSVTLNFTRVFQMREFRQLSVTSIQSSYIVPIHSCLKKGKKKFNEIINSKVGVLAAWNNHRG